MTWTRRYSSGFEMQNLSEGDAYANGIYGSGNPVVSSAKAHTGTYSMRFSLTSYPFGIGWNTGGEPLLRMGYYLNHSGVSPSSSGGNFAIIPLTDATHIQIYWSGDDNLIYIRKGGVNLVSVTPAAVGITTIDRWYHIGVTAYIHATSGYISLYIDGVLALTFTGNTGTAGMVGAYAGGTATSGSSGWTNPLHIDDFFVDMGSAEADAVVPSRRFLWCPVIADGPTVNWTASAGSDFQCVDEAPANDDTDYVWIDTDNEIEYFQVSSPTIPVGYTISAVVPVVHARKTDVAIDSRLSLEVYQSPGVFTPSTDLPLTTTYHGYPGFFPAAPDTTPWDLTKFNACRYGFRSEGAF